MRETPDGQVHYRSAAHVATLTLDRPSAMNAFGGRMREDLLTHLEQAVADTSIRCIVITGAGRAFCAGGDIASMAALQEAGDCDEVTARMRVAARVVTLIQAAPKPVIAAVNGAAAGAGMNLALACDLRYAAAGAVFAESFIRIGLVPDWGGHHLLTRLVGGARALELMLSGARIDAAEAVRLGLVNRVIPDAEFQAFVQQQSAALAGAPAAAVAAIKQGIQRAADGTLADTLAWEMETQRALFLGADAREGMRAFLARRAPRFNADGDAVEEP
jgi:2-(1,2-epoxy-1,2-dihydrophenyl)acetyl-CoA isomerase